MIYSELESQSVAKPSLCVPEPEQQDEVTLELNLESSSEISPAEYDEFLGWKMRREQARKRLRGLTKRERDVSLLILEGCTSREVGSRLGISSKTVEKHRANAYLNAQCSSVAKFVRVLAVADLATIPSTHSGNIQM